jgi:hypothetical protein
MPHAQLARNGGDGGTVARADSTLGGLGVGAEGSFEGCEGGKCMRFRRRGTL